MKRLYILLICLILSALLLVYRTLNVHVEPPEVAQITPQQVPKPKTVIKGGFGLCKDKRREVEDAPEVAGLEPTAMVLSSDCRWLIAGNENGSLQVFDRESGRLLGVNPGHALRVARLLVSPDDKYFFSSGQGSGEVLVLSLPEARKIATINTEEQSEQALAFDPRRKLLVTGGSRFLKGWNIKPDAAGRLFGLEQPVFAVPVRRAVNSLAVSPDSKHIAAGETGSIQLWETNDGTALQIKEIAYRERYEAKDWVMGVAFTVDGKAVATASRMKRIGLWQVPSLESMPQAFAEEPRWELYTNPGWLEVAPVRDHRGDDKLKLIFKLHDSTADRVYAAWAGRTIRNVSALRGEVNVTGNSSGVLFYDFNGIDPPVQTMLIPSATGGARTMMHNYAVLPDASVLVVKRRTAEISLIDLQQLKEVRKIGSVAGPVSLQIVSEGKLAAYSDANEVGFIDIETGKKQKVPRPKQGGQQLINLQITPSLDGAGVVAVFGENLVEIRSDLGITKVAKLPLMAVSFIAPLRSRQAYIVAGPEDTLVIGKDGIKASLPIKVSLDNTAAISQDEQTMVVKHLDGICRYTLSENSSCTTISSSKNDPRGVFDTDDKVLVQGGSSKMLRLLNASSGDEMLRMEGHIAEITYVKLLGSKVLSIDATGEVRIWAIADGSLVAKARP